jgi:hypothetical protein
MNRPTVHRARQRRAFNLQGKFAESNRLCVLSTGAKNLNKLTQSLNDIGRPPD